MNNTFNPETQHPCDRCGAIMNKDDLTIYRLLADSQKRFKNHKYNKFLLCFCDSCQEEIMFIVNNTLSRRMNNKSQEDKNGYK